MSHVSVTIERCLLRSVLLSPMHISLFVRIVVLSYPHSLARARLRLTVHIICFATHVHRTPTNHNISYQNAHALLGRFPREGILVAYLAVAAHRQPVVYTVRVLWNACLFSSGSTDLRTDHEYIRTDAEREVYKIVPMGKLAGMSKADTTV